MGRGVSVKEKEYEYIKELLQKGKSAEEIAKMLNRSPDTIRTVDYSDDYGDFVKTPTKELRKRRKNLFDRNKQKAEELAKEYEQLSFPKLCPCLESAYLFLRDECQNVQIVNGLLTVTMEVSKWESLF